MAFDQLWGFLPAAPGSKATATASESYSISISNMLTAIALAAAPRSKAATTEYESKGVITAYCNILCNNGTYLRKKGSEEYCVFGIFSTQIE